MDTIRHWVEILTCWAQEHCKKNRKETVERTEIKLKMQIMPCWSPRVWNRCPNSSRSQTITDQWGHERLRRWRTLSDWSAPERGRTLCCRTSYHCRKSRRPGSCFPWKARWCDWQNSEVGNDWCWEMLRTTCANTFASPQELNKKASHSQANKLNQFRQPIGSKVWHGERDVDIHIHKQKYRYK